MTCSPAAGRAVRIAAAALVVPLALLRPSGTHAQPASLIADLAQGHPVSSGLFDVVPLSSPTVTLGGSAYFFADDQLHGKELWVTDGTAAGSRMVIDLCPGSCSSGGGALTAWNGKLFFWAWDGDHAGGGPWSSDGTAAGTQRLADVQTFGPVGFFGLDADVYFAADDATHGLELWRTDGTPGGTGLFADLDAGSAGSSPYLLAASSTQLFFGTDDGAGRVLWRTDGTLAGTWSLPTVTPPFIPMRDAFLPGGELVLASFPPSGHREVWRTDGTPGGTSMIVDFGADGSEVKAFQRFGTGVCFAHNGELWTTDGTPGGTVLVASIPDGGMITSWVMTPAGGLLYFGASTASLGNELWKTDGTGAGTGIVKDLNPGGASGLRNDIFTVLFGGSLGAPLASGGLFFHGQDGSHGEEPWGTDGSEAGTILLADIAPGTAGSGNNLSAPGTLGGETLFPALGLPGPSSLWRSDGTAAGTQRIVQPNQQVSSLTWPFSAQFTPTEYGALFRADDHEHGMQFWVDGPPSAPHLLADLSPLDAFQVEARLGGKVFLTAGSALQPGLSAELLVTDGAGVEVLDTASSGTFQDFFAFDGSVFYVRGDSTGPSLWRSDGTAAGTTAVASWPGASGVAAFVSGAGVWVQVSTSASSVQTLWRSDGTPMGTAPVATLASSSSCVAPQDDGGLLVATQTFDAGSSTTAISRVSTTGTITPLGTFPHFLAACQPIDDRLLLFVDDGTHGVEPWVDDGAPSGTAQGTAALGDIAPGPAGSRASDFAEFGRRVVFSSDDQVHGRELWLTDGTSAGTRLVADTRSGGSSSVPQAIAAADGLLLFSAADGTHGRELFASDGTPAGTKLVQDVAPNDESSSPAGFAAIGPNVYFYADDATHGFEPWKLSRRALANVVPAALSFYTTAPCRLLDTRATTALAAGAPLTFAAAGQCGIPLTALAVAVNITSVGATADGSIALYPADEAVPGPGLAPVAAGRTRATNAVVRVALDDIGALTALAQLPPGEQMHLLVDVSGYFAP